MIYISFLRDNKGAAKFGSCAACGISHSEDLNMIAVNFSDGDNNTAVHLCASCRNKLKKALNAMEAFDDFLQ